MRLPHFRKPIIEMAMIEPESVTVVDCNKSALEKLKAIIKGEEHKIGDVVWATRKDEGIVTLLFFTYDRIRVNNIYIVTYQHLLALLQFLNRAPQSI